MNILLSARLGGWLLVALGALQVLPALVAWIYAEPIIPYFAAGGVGWKLPGSFVREFGFQLAT